MGGGRLVLRTGEESDDIGMQRMVVALERKDIVAALADDPASNVTLTIERVCGYDPALQREHLQQLDDCGALFGLGCRSDLGKHQARVAAPGADHMQSGSAMSGVEGPAQDLAIDGDNAGRGFAETRREPLKTRTELVGIELTNHAAEGVVARDPVLQLQKVAEEFLLGLGEYGHVDRGL